MPPFQFSSAILMPASSLGPFVAEVLPFAPAPLLAQPVNATAITSAAHAERNIVLRTSVPSLLLLLVSHRGNCCVRTARNRQGVYRSLGFPARCFTQIAVFDVCGGGWV